MSTRDKLERVEPERKARKPDEFEWSDPFDWILNLVRPFTSPVLIAILITGFVFLMHYAISFGSIQLDKKGTLENVREVLEIFALITGLLWFLYTAQFKPRISFDIGCAFFRPRSDLLLAEMTFIFENKGFVEHFITKLVCTGYTLDDEPLSVYDDTYEPVFTKRLVPANSHKGKALNVMPRRFRYFYVRPGVRQMITRTVCLPATTDLIQIRSKFKYSFMPGDFHAAQRIFMIPPAGDHAIH